MRPYSWVESEIIQIFATRGAGGGQNTLVLNGDFSGGVTLTGGEIKNIDTLKLTAGHSYDIATNGSSKIATIDGSALGAGDTLTFDASASTVAQDVIGGAGNDMITGSPAGSNFDISHGGDDTIISNGGAFIAGGALSAGDRLEGHGSDYLELDGDYSAGLVLAATTFTGVHEIDFMGGFSYNLTENDGNVAAGQTLLIDSGLTAGQTLEFNGAAETDGSFVFIGDGETTDILTGGAGNDIFDLRNTGLGAGAHVDGGGGADVLNIAYITNVTNGDVVFSDQTISGISTINTGGDLTTADGNVAAGETLTVNSAGRLFDGSKETDGSFIVNMTGRGVTVHAIGGAGDDVISIASQVNKTATVEGGGGADVINLGNPQPTFQDIVVYNTASDSTGANYDTVNDFSTGHDEFQFTFAVTAVDASVTTGTLSTASFDTDLTAAIGSAQLGAHHAVLFTPDSGTLANHSFLIVDANGTAGYQAGEDFVIQVSNQTYTTADFIT